MSDVNCDISFNRKQIKINVVVKNGKGNTTESVYYGDSKSIIVEPNDGFKNAKVSCTNGQTATFDNNTINFTSLTSDTSCTITFQKLAVVNYKLNVSNPTEFENISLIASIWNISDIKLWPFVIYPSTACVKASIPVAAAKDFGIDSINSESTIAKIGMLLGSTQTILI